MGYTPLEGLMMGTRSGDIDPYVRTRTCEGLAWFGLDLDHTRNERTNDCEGRITTDDSRLSAWVIPTEEGLLIAQQVIRWLRSARVSNRACSVTY